MGWLPLCLKVHPDGCIKASSRYNSPAADASLTVGVGGGVCGGVTGGVTGCVTGCTGVTAGVGVTAGGAAETGSKGRERGHKVSVNTSGDVAAAATSCSYQVSVGNGS